jgi:DNA topoisomerase-3
MQIMEKLYNKGFLSYPRTETQKYNPTINLKKIVSELTKSPEIGAFATKVASGE